MEHYAIYRRPPEHPNHYVVRRWDVRDGVAIPTEQINLARSLEEARSYIPAGLIRTPPMEGDHPVVEEVWI